MSSASVQRLARIALIGFLCTITAACVIGTGGCSTEEAATFSEVQHYAGTELVPKDDGLGGCGASFTTSDDPDLVIQHYRSRLEGAGWTIDPPEPLPPDGVEIQSVSLGAHKETMGFGVSAEIVGGPETEFVIHIREND